MRVRLYNKEHPEGKVFVGEKEYSQALAEGVWYENFWMPSGVVPEDLKESWGNKPIEPLRLPEKTKPIIKEEVINKITDNFITETPYPKEPDIYKKKGKKYCECGCGTEVKGRFAAGHYAKWKSQQEKIKDGNRKDDKPAD